jgi:hypothetical protein
LQDDDDYEQEDDYESDPELTPGQAKDIVDSIPAFEYGIVKECAICSNELGKG